MEESPSTSYAPGLEQRSVAFSTATALPAITISGVEAVEPLDDEAPKTDQRARRAMVRARERSYPELEITDIDFKLYSTREIDDMAVVIVDNESSLGGRNTTNDPRLGPHNISEYCEKCFKGIYECTGHIGKIILPKIPNPLTINFLIMTLSVICNVCGKLLVSAADLERNGILKYHGLGRLTAIRDLVE